MNRKIKITNTTQESTNHLRQVPLFLEDRPDTHLATYAENVYIGGRKALTEGKFHDMFLAGDGHELEDYTDENGKQRIAHARSIYSSSMLAYNFFHWISPERPLTLNGTTYDKVYFEVKFPIFTKPTEGRPVNRPSNMDIVLISEDCLTMLCIESKYTEHTHHQTAIFSDAYITPSCYYKGNPYRATFQRLAMCYNEKSNGYFAGIKQNVSHLIGITNVMHDDKALAWFKANNPFIEPEVLAQISHNTEFIFTNLLYCRPEDVDDFFGDLQAEEHPYPYLLAELLFDDLQKDLDEPLLLSSFIKTYPELFAEVQSQMQKPLADYLDNRYVLTPQPHFALPEGYDTADHYLIDVVMEGARKRYKNHYSDEVSARIKSELKAIRVRHWADRFLIMWDLMRELHHNRFCTTPGGNRTAGSVVAYCLGITDIEPLGANLSEAGMFYRPTFPDLFIELSKPGTAFADQYTQEKYGELASKIVYRYYYIMDIVEQTIANLDIDINFSAIPYDSPELLRFFMNDDNWRQYTYFGQCDMDRLRGLDNPTLEDMVYIFGDRPFENGKHVTINREHCYGRCVLFLRTAWLKMHFPETFNKVADARFKPGNYHQLIVAGLKEDEIESEVDFTPDGQAIINMPNYKDISFLENFGFSPIESVEQEISQADCPERAAFLQHYIKVFKETFSAPPNSYLKEPDEDETLDFETLSERTICFRNIRLLHTSAWYMMNHIPAEINAVKRHIEELDGQQVAAENLEEVIRLIRQSQNPQDACARLQKRFEIGYIKARYILDLPLTELSSSTIVSIAIEKEDYRKRLEFLLKLQPNGVMGAMYFDKKGIPFHLS